MKEHSLMRHPVLGTLSLLAACGVALGQQATAQLEGRSLIKAGRCCPPRALARRSAEGVSVNGNYTWAF